MQRKIFQLIALALIGVVGAFLIRADYAEQLQFWRGASTPVLAQGERIKGEIPESIMPCLPQGTDIKELELESQTSFKGKHFYLVKVKEELATIFEDFTRVLARNTIIQEDDLGCLVVMPREESRKRSLYFYLPVPAARQLTLNFVKRRIELVGGKEAFMASYQDIPRDAADGAWIVFPEDVWAYEQLGLELPEPHVIVKTEDEAPRPTPGLD